MTPGRRWAVLMSLLATTIGLIVTGPDEATANVPARSAPRSWAPVAVAPQTRNPVLASVPPVDGLAQTNPFEPRQWTQPPDAPAAPVPIKVEAAAPPPLVDTGPPPLPFKYLGRFNDDTGTVVYLGKADKTLLVHGGDTLEGTYKVVAMEPQKIEFEHLASGVRQVLAVPLGENP